MKLPKEYEIELPVMRGSKGRPVRLIQEWLSLNGLGLTIDSSYGPATESAVRAFQKQVGRKSTGSVNELTFNELIAPITRALSPLEASGEQTTFSSRVIVAAQKHLAEHPREVGGTNCGPWVRHYTGGHEGDAWAWCAGFVTAMLRAAAEGQPAEVRAPIRGSLSCDTLTAQARAAGCFVAERQRQSASPSLSGGAIFLVRSKKNASDWIHTGIVTALHDEYFETIEGNTNDSGDREGYEVCARRRSYKNMDFIRL